MSVYFDYPSIRDFFEIHGNTSKEKLDDYENCRAESDRLYNEQANKEILVRDSQETDNNTKQ